MLPAKFTAKAAAKISAAASALLAITARRYSGAIAPPSAYRVHSKSTRQSKRHTGIAAARRAARKLQNIRRNKKH